MLTPTGRVMKKSVVVTAALLLFALVNRLWAETSVDALVTLKTDVMVPSRTAGTLLTVAAREGQIVERGQVLAELDATLARGDYQASLHEVSVYQLQRENDVDVRLSQKTRDVSQRELQRSLRANDLYSQAVSATELERLQMLVDQAELSEEKARSDLEIANAHFELKRTLATSNKDRLEMHRIVSPIRGMVVARKATVGEWLDVGQAFARVIQLDVLRVEANVDGTKHGDELLGREVSFRTLYGNENRDYIGKIIFVSPEIDPVDGMIRIWADVENEAQTLKPGMRGTLRLPTNGPKKQ